MGKKSKKAKGDADLLDPAVAQDLHQADQAAVWLEQVPNALDHLRQGLLIGYLLAFLVHR